MLPKCRHVALLPKGDTLWQWSDALTNDGAGFLLLEGDTVTLEITHTKTGVVVERSAASDEGDGAPAAAAAAARSCREGPRRTWLVVVVGGGGARAERFQT